MFERLLHLRFVIILFPVLYQPFYLLACRGGGSGVTSQLRSYKYRYRPKPFVFVFTRGRYKMLALGVVFVILVAVVGASQLPYPDRARAITNAGNPSTGFSNSGTFVGVVTTDTDASNILQGTDVSSGFPSQVSQNNAALQGQGSQILGFATTQANGNIFKQNFGRNQVDLEQLQNANLINANLNAFGTIQSQNFIPSSTSNSIPAVSGNLQILPGTSGIPSGSAPDSVTTVRIPRTSFNAQQIQNLILTNAGLQSDESNSNSNPFSIRLVDVQQLTVVDTNTLFNLVTHTATVTSVVTSKTTLLNTVARTVHQTVTVYTRPDDKLSIPEVSSTATLVSTVTNVVTKAHIRTSTIFVTSTLPTLFTRIVPVTSQATHIITNTLSVTSTVTEFITGRPATYTVTRTISTYAHYVPPRTYN